MANAFVCAFIIFQIILGGASGILIGAIILNWMIPGHPIYLGIQAWLRSVIG